MRAAGLSAPALVGLTLLLVALVVAGLVLLPRLVETPDQAFPPGGRPPAAGWYDVYFTEPVIPDRRELHRGGLDERLVEFIRGATSSLDVAVYDFDLANVATALAEAKGRGVGVRFVTDSDTLDNRTNGEVQAAFDILRTAGVSIVADGRQPIMHHKFVIRDRQEVWTGSWNFTDGDTYRLNNNAARLRSPELAANFTAEFEKMFVARQFGAAKSPGVPHPRVSVGGATVETHFSPQDRPSRAIIGRVGAATTSLHFLAFSFTHDEIGRAVLARHQTGVLVSGVFERTGSETQFSEFRAFKAAGLDVYQDGSPYAMHHKVFVLDGRATLFGSYNFSSNADRDNDENLLVVDDPSFAALFEQEFQRMLALAKNPPATRGSATPRPR